jgi:hypothetical protein
MGRIFFWIVSFNMPKVYGVRRKGKVSCDWEIISVFQEREQGVSAFNGQSVDWWTSPLAFYIRKSAVAGRQHLIQDRTHLPDVFRGPAMVETFPPPRHGQNRCRRKQAKPKASFRIPVHVGGTGIKIHVPIPFETIFANDIRLTIERDLFCQTGAERQTSQVVVTKFLLARER